MNYVDAIIAGIVGTLFMTGFLYLLTYITERNYKVVRVLSIMLTNDHSAHGADLKPLTLTIGIIVHYMIGIMFAVIYLWLWEHGIGKPDLVNGIIFGSLNGIFAAAFWFTFIRLHPHPPKVPMPDYLIAIGLGHIIFATGTVFIFNLLAFTNLTN